MGAFCPQLIHAEALHVSAPLDPALPPAQGRQQALDTAMAVAVMQDALRILPAPLSAPRADALRRFLEPKSRELVLSYQEAVPKTQPPAQGLAEAQPAAGQTPGVPPTPPAALEYDIEVNRAALRTQLQGLGLLSAGARSYSLRLGPGVAEGQLTALAELNLLMGLERAPAGMPAPLSITLEKLPQGYYKAVLSQAAPNSKPFAADGGDLPAVWRNLFVMLFSGSDYRPGGADRPLEITGWMNVDGVFDFDRLLASWDDCAQDARLSAAMLANGTISARWTARVTNPQRLSARLNETLPPRGLRLVRPETLSGGALQP